jgi:hypothetical protein
VGRSVIHGGDDSTRLLWFEIGDNPVNRLLGRDSEDSTILVGARQVVAEQVLDKTANGRETTIACHCGISPLGFDMIQEGEHGICLEIIEAQISYGLTSALNEKHEEELERAAVSTLQVTVEEALNQSQERVPLVAAHSSTLLSSWAFR